jgi:hypothetical protein
MTAADRTTLKDTHFQFIKPQCEIAATTVRINHMTDV